MLTHRHVAAIAAIAGAVLSACGARSEIALGGAGAPSTTGSGTTTRTMSPPTPQDLESVLLTGALDGEPVCASFQVGVGGLSWATPPAPGALLLEQETPNRPGSALFQMPAGSPFAGQWFCAGNAVAPAPMNFMPSTNTLSNISRLGACPGVPVSGAVTLCSSISSTPGMNDCSGYDATIASTLIGATFTTQGELTNVGGDISDGIVGWLEGVGPTGASPGTVAALVYDKSGWSGTVMQGVLLVGPGNPDAGAVYCISGGTSSETLTTHEFTLTGLSRLGTCAMSPVVGGTIEATAYP